MVLQGIEEHLSASDAGDSQDRPGVDCGGGTGISLAIRAGDGASRIPQKPFASFRVIGTIHYVGSTNAGAFLISTPEGHILLDTGYPKTEAWVRTSIEQLGFRLADIKLILNTHAHSDHVGGHAQFKEWTGAKILTSQADAPVLADGGRSDFRSDGRELWRPVAADGIVGDGQEVTLGGVTLVAHMTPGHTKGNTTWTMMVDEGGRSTT